MKISICSNYSCLSNETVHPMIIVLHEDIYVGIIVTSAKSLRDILCYNIIIVDHYNNYMRIIF